jgi:hypothetical protein
MESGDSCGSLPEASRQNAAENALVYIRATKTGTLHGCANGDRAEVCCTQLAECSLKLSYRRSHSTDDHNFTHDVAPSMNYSAHIIPPREHDRHARVSAPKKFLPWETLFA